MLDFFFFFWTQEENIYSLNTILNPGLFQ